ncbi:MAG: D-arabinose 5-phosphate isomerase [Acidiferrobacteraceae bacterium]|jgi:arabinose-5-phosphate isomerase|nr:D-arabinose 5-phosphate isomerase [Acidiferrobacteraceae bacterium]MDP6434994.1 KpsF/GutQ family sugar-phosphate isomerase [Arenicellales bacterium]MDP6672564.1 KpsF/GutQ family sugar-phosphate isomerase [Arenicellales bacterium]MDP6724996.1 KpsF/GutQ family sugar-phosphate isomerase [Arenicellales bacterium]|tara:strand:+ start:20097 stop:21086 length:990 start_codon:yes stop_codon:yes gene_type:complete
MINTDLPTPESCISDAQDVVAIELSAVKTLQQRIGQPFSLACEFMLGCTGRVIVVGMGKSGHIGGKIAATLASTGTPAFFVHPGEASHGDLGMITPADIVLAISYSGETHELLTIIPIVKRMGVKLITMTGRASSTIASESDVVLDISVEREACPLNLAPTASTTITLVLGDAIAVALLRARKFDEQDFALSHPGGALGRRLLLLVSDIMRTESQIPLVSTDATLPEALLEMTSKTLGMTGIINDQQILVGIFTDGDLRRALETSIDIYDVKINQVMTPSPRSVRPDTLAVEVVEMMRNQAINGIFVVDENDTILGALNTHDLFRAGIL